jgi:hypothetical protein
MAKKPEKSGEKRNGKELLRLQKKRFRAVGWFTFWLAFMPLSLCGGCGLAMVIRNETVQAVFGMGGLLAPFVGLGGVLLMLGDRSRYSRSLAMVQQATELNLTYTEQPGRSLYAFLNHLSLFQEPTNDFALNFMTGLYEGATVVILDYNCSWGHGKWAQTTTQTVIVFRDALDGVSDLILYPKSLVAKLAEAVGLGGKPIPVPGQKEFASTYGLYSEDRKGTAELFTPELVEACLEERSLALEVKDRSLLVYWVDTYIRPADLPKRLETADWIHQQLRGV